MGRKGAGREYSMNAKAETSMSLSGYTDLLTTNQFKSDVYQGNDNISYLEGW